MTAAPTSWRTRVATHPAADLFPMMPDDELDALGKDIEVNGLQQPLVLWTPERSPGRKGPKEVYLLDGRNRLEAIERAYADDADSLHEAIENALYIGAGGVRLIYGDDDPWTFVISANAHRRHLTREKKRDVVAALLKARPERSDRETAKIAKVSHPTVAVVRAELEAAGDVENLSTRTDTAGRQQPAHRPAPAAVVHRSSLPPPPSKEEQLRQMREQQAQRTEAPAATPPDEVMAACFDPLMLRLDEYREGLRHVPLDQLARAVLGVMARLGVTIEMLEEEAAGQ